MKAHPQQYAEEFLSLESRTFDAYETAGECPRCGAEHGSISPVHAFYRPVEDEFITWGWWAPCPTTGDPVLIAEWPAGTPKGLTHLEVVQWVRTGEDPRLVR